MFFCQNLLPGPGLALTLQLMLKEAPQEPSTGRVLPASLGHLAPVGLGAALVVVVVVVVVEEEEVVALVYVVQVLVVETWVVVVGATV